MGNAQKVEITGVSKTGVSATVTNSDGSQYTTEIHGNNKAEVEAMINAEYGDAETVWGDGISVGGSGSGSGGSSGSGLWKWLTGLFRAKK